MLVKKTGKFDIYEVNVLCEDKTTKFKVKGGTEVKVLRKNIDTAYCLSYTTHSIKLVY